MLNEEWDQPVGMPQGLLVSPVLSALYTSPLLNIAMGWNNSTLGMYIDNGIILAVAPDWDDVVSFLKVRYTCCAEWLQIVNLAAEPDKTEFICF